MAMRPPLVRARGVDVGQGEGMVFDYPEELTAQERAVFAIWLLAQDWQPTTAEAAQRLGVTTEGARALLGNLAKSLPISQDDEGRWSMDGDECKAFDGGDGGDEETRRAHTGG